MAELVLVHGGSRDAGVWSEVQPNLEALGHRVVCPSLPDAATSTFEEHVQTVVESVRAAGMTRFLLAGHSYGGLVVTVAGARLALSVSTLTYLDSAFPEPGKSLFGLAEDAGIQPLEDFGIDPDPPFVVPLEFDLEVWRSMPKAYVRALRSEFAVITEISRAKVHERMATDGWLYGEIDTRHNMMIEDPAGVAALLDRLA
jgi:pimeloyl-ACP methyl ester carboxylesterase